MLLLQVGHKFGLRDFIFFECDNIVFQLFQLDFCVGYPLLLIANSILQVFELVIKLSQRCPFLLKLVLCSCVVRLCHMRMICEDTGIEENHTSCLASLVLSAAMSL